MASSRDACTLPRPRAALTISMLDLAVTSYEISEAGISAMARFPVTPMAPMTSRRSLLVETLPAAGGSNVLA
jgi:hypothetical protein